MEFNMSTAFKLCRWWRSVRYTRFCVHTFDTFSCLVFVILTVIYTRCSLNSLNHCLWKSRIGYHTTWNLNLSQSLTSSCFPLVKVIWKSVFNHFHTQTLTSLWCVILCFCRSLRLHQLENTGLISYCRVSLGQVITATSGYISQILCWWFNTTASLFPELEIFFVDKSRDKLGSQSESSPLQMILLPFHHVESAANGPADALGYRPHFAKGFGSKTLIDGTKTNWQIGSPKLVTTIM